MGSTTWQQMRARTNANLLWKTATRTAMLQECKHIQSGTLILCPMMVIIHPDPLPLKSHWLFLDFFFNRNRFSLAQIGPKLSLRHQGWSWIFLHLHPPPPNTVITDTCHHTCPMWHWGLCACWQVIYQLSCIPALLNLDYSSRLWWPTKHLSSLLWEQHSQGSWSGWYPFCAQQRILPSSKGKARVHQEPMWTLLP